MSLTSVAWLILGIVSSLFGELSNFSKASESMKDGARLPVSLSAMSFQCHLFLLSSSPNLISLLSDKITGVVFIS